MQPPTVRRSPRSPLTPFSPRLRVTAAALFLSAPLASGVAQQDATTFLITNARVIDGSGAPARRAAVRVSGDRIVAVGNLSRDAEEPVIDARGLVLTPGFIDTHSHHDWGLSDAPNALAAVSQGITTIIVGQDGGSPFPLADFFAALEQSPAAVNVAAYVGHNTLRRRVLGDDFRRYATPAEVAYMKLLLEHELAAGALGLSTGLEYDPGIYASTSEVVALARLAAVAGGRYISHIRSEDRYFWEAVNETIRIGREAGIPVQIGHMKLAMRGLWGQADSLLRVLDHARSTGVDVTADVYPYPYWQSTMTVLFPERDFDNRETAAYVLQEVVPPEGVLIAEYEPDPSYVGKTLADIAKLRGSDAVTTLMELIATAQRTGADESMIGTSMAERDIEELLAWRHTNVSSDGALNGRHPRGFGAFPRVLARYVRQRGVLDLAEAIHKMTGLSADHVGIPNRGRIEPGAYADLVLLNPETVMDHATPEDPQRIATGIEAVWVNGVLVYSNGMSTGARPGTVIRRGEWGVGSRE